MLYYCRTEPAVCFHVPVFLCHGVAGSESDCYVILSLPTATARTYRTKTVSNSNNPEWNETFTFRVPTHVKVSVLNIAVASDTSIWPTVQLLFSPPWKEPIYLVFPQWCSKYIHIQMTSSIPFFATFLTANCHINL